MTRNERIIESRERQIDGLRLRIKDLEAENERLKTDKDELYQTAMEMFYWFRDDMPTWERILDKHSVHKEEEK